MTRISMPAGAGVLRRIIPVAMFCACVLTGCSRREAVLPVIPYPAAAEVYDDVFEMQNMSWWIDPAADRLSRAAILRFFDAAAGGAMQKNSPAARQDEADIRFIVDKKLPGEHYRLEVGRNGIRVDASDFRGFIYACQTLRQLCPAVPFCRVEDGPRFRYRGMHLDVSRHFFPVATVKRFIDLLELHKLNVLHWHLTDDQGWRIEIDAYPRLTETGAFRRDTTLAGEPGTFGGYYTKRQIRDIVEYAARRYIEVVPEIDMPGHMTAALASYPELGCTGGPYVITSQPGVRRDILCAGNPAVFDFVEKVLEEVIELFPSEYIHIGGDECPKESWKTCPMCQQRIKDEGLKDEFELQSYTVRRMEKWLGEHGRKIIGWDEILEGGVSPTATVMSWRGSKGGIAAAKAGNHVIMAPNDFCYLDYYQTKDPMKEPLGIGGFVPVSKSYALDPYNGLAPEERPYILGVQANLWTEYIFTSTHLKHMLLPRLAAMSEVAWATERRDYDDFVRRLGSLRGLYDREGYRYADFVFRGIE